MYRKKGSSWKKIERDDAYTATIYDDGEEKRAKTHPTAAGQ